MNALSFFMAPHRMLQTLVLRLCLGATAPESRLLGQPLSSPFTWELTVVCAVGCGHVCSPVGSAPGPALQPHLLPQVLTAMRLGAVQSRPSPPRALSAEFGEWNDTNSVLSLTTARADRHAALR